MRLFIALIIALLGSVGLNLYQWQNNKTSPDGYLVEGVIDGDTLVLEGKVKIRLRAADAPELEFCGGLEAKTELEKLVSNQRVLIKEKIMDLRGRPMALVYVNKTLVNEKMIESGWSKYHSDVVTKKKELKAAQAQAKENSRGIWSEVCRQTENKAQPECNIKANFDDNSRKRKIYYYPGCPQYKFTIIEKDMGEDWFCTRDQAEAAGFVKAKNCPD